MCFGPRDLNDEKLFRRYIVCSDAQWLLILPALLYVATVAVGILSLVPTVSNAGRMTFGGICILLSVIMNISITVTISARLVKARRHFTKALPKGSTNVIAQYTGVVAILVESALPLSVFGLVYAMIIATTRATDSDKLQKEVAIYVFSILYFSFAALSPQMIIFRVTTGRSWTGELHKSIEDSRKYSTSELPSGMVFAKTVAENETALELGEAMRHSMEIRREASVEKP